MNEGNRRAALLDDLERLLAEYRDVRPLVIVLGTLGAALNEGLGTELANFVYRWCEEYIKPLVQP